MRKGIKAEYKGGRLLLMPYDSKGKRLGVIDTGV